MTSKSLDISGLNNIPIVITKYWDYVPIKWKIILCIIIFILIIVVANGYSNSCPKCKKWWKFIKYKTDKIKIGEGYETVERKDVQRIKGTTGYIFNLKPINATSVTKRLEQVHMGYYKNTIYYKCPSCGYEWTGVYRSKLEE